MMRMTRELAYAASKDAAVRSMTKAGRTSWSLSDYSAAVRTFDRLMPDAEEDRNLLNHITSSGYTVPEVSPVTVEG